MPSPCLCPPPISSTVFPARAAVTFWLGEIPGVSSSDATAQEFPEDAVGSWENISKIEWDEITMFVHFAFNLHHLICEGHHLHFSDEKTDRHVGWCTHGQSLATCGGWTSSTHILIQNLFFWAREEANSKAFDTKAE